ncbi:hypothetical protein V8Q18_06280 [Acinetobacter baumannii]
MKRADTFQIIKSYKEKHPFVFYFMILYLGGILIYILIFHLWFADYSSPMSLNELGDFLAGVFAPIAFLFLYLGYKQNSESLKIQSEELRASTKAITLQVAEMKESVEQQKVLSELQRVELEEKHISVTPVFSLHVVIEVTPKHGPSGLTFMHILKFSIENPSDSDARNLKITIGNTIERRFELIPRNGKQQINTLFTDYEVDQYKAKENFDREVSIEFDNIFGRRYKTLFNMECKFENGSPRIYIENLGTSKH